MNALKADVQDRDGAKDVLFPLKEKHRRLKKIWAHASYRGELIQWLHDLRQGRGHRRLELEIVVKAACFAQDVMRQQGVEIN